MSFIDLHVVYLLIGLILLIVEVVLGMALGIALSAAITFFMLGLATWLDLIDGFNSHLIFGVVVFVIATFIVLKIFKNRIRRTEEAQDVNDY